jgi:hypothetical protein
MYRDFACRYDDLMTALVASAIGSALVLGLVSAILWLS